ncbi:hypothetical protein [Leucobacter coleopterorum]|uniref:hypothetical protein n=1 Tax=Leucobacter coleopterorum TaxID=2714933 RepID=UPI001FCAB2EE|nr:hypothetical protein [Leucobacter coleopterorum]
MLAVRHHLRWIAPLFVLGIAAVLRFWALGSPSTLVFDEIYYVRDAISQLAHGYPTTWPNDDPTLPNALGFTDTASYSVHPRWASGFWGSGSCYLVLTTGGGGAAPLRLQE